MQGEIQPRSLINNRVTDWVDVLRLTVQTFHCAKEPELSRDAFRKKIEECKQMLLAAASALKKKEFKKRKPRHTPCHVHDCATPSTWHEATINTRWQQHTITVVTTTTKVWYTRLRH